MVSGQKADRNPQERDKTGKSKEDILVDELLGNSAPKEETKQQNFPFLQRTDHSRLSGTISGKQGKTAEGTSKPYVPVAPDKPSVREELKEIRAGRKKDDHAPKWKEPERNRGGKNKKIPQHKQPKAKRKLKKQKER